MCLTELLGIFALLICVILLPVFVIISGYFVKIFVIWHQLGRLPDLWTLVSADGFVRLDSTHFFYGVCLLAAVCVVALILRCCLAILSALVVRARTEDVEMPSCGGPLCEGEGTTCDTGEFPLAAVLFGTLIVGLLVIFVRKCFALADAEPPTSSGDVAKARIDALQLDYFDAIIFLGCLTVGILLGLCNMRRQREAED